MTWSAQFEVTEVEDGKIVAKASTVNEHPDQVASLEFGKLSQNTEKAKRMTLIVDLEDGAETQIKVGDTMTASGHFTS
jgi:hypothetical protein